MTLFIIACMCFLLPMAHRVSTVGHVKAIFFGRATIPAYERITFGCLINDTKHGIDAGSSLVNYHQNKGLFMGFVIGSYFIPTTYSSGLTLRRKDVLNIYTAIKLKVVPFPLQNLAVLPCSLTKND